jgi:hypothetical protein
MLDLLIRIAKNVIIVVGGPSHEEGTVMGVPPARSTTTPDAGARRDLDRIGVRGPAGAWAGTVRRMIAQRSPG